MILKRVARHAWTEVKAWRTSERLEKAVCGLVALALAYVLWLFLVRLR